MLKKLLLAAASGTFALSAFAADANQVEKLIELKDGSTVYVFTDGKMGVEDRFGRARHTAPGHVLDTKGGGKIVVNGNEVARVHELLSKRNPPY